MNTLEVSLSQQTIDSAVKRGLQFLRQESPLNKELFNERGIKVIGNVHVKSIDLESVTLKEPNIIEVNKVEVAFFLLNIAIEVDVKRIHDKLKILGVTVASWDLFESNPDIELTVGIENLIKPNFSFSLKSFLNNREVVVGLNDFKINTLNLSDDISGQIKQNIINEVKRIIKDAIPGNYEDKVLDLIGDLANLLPMNNIGDWIVGKLLDNRKIEELIEDAAKNMIDNEVVYIAPSNLTLGTGEKQVTLALEDANPIALNVKEHRLITTINFKDL